MYSTFLATRDETQEYDNYSLLHYLAEKDKAIKISPNIESNQNELTLKFLPSDKLFSNVELNKLYYVSGMIVQKVFKLKRFANCSICKSATISKHPIKARYAKYTLLRNFSMRNALNFVTETCFKMGLHFESTFLSMKEQGALDQMTSFLTFRQYALNYENCLPNCHDLFEKLIEYFWKFRLNMSLKPRNRNRETKIKGVM